MVKIIKVRVGLVCLRNGSKISVVRIKRKGIR